MQVSIDNLEKKYKEVKKIYDAGANSIESIGQLAISALEFLSVLESVPAGTKVVEGKNVEYSLYSSNFKGSEVFSRPFRVDLFVKDKAEFAEQWEALKSKIDSDNHKLIYGRTNSVLYTTILSFSIVYDLHKKGVKAPGTFFEVVIGTLVGMISGLAREKHIKLPEKPAPELVKLSAPDAQIPVSEDSHEEDEPENLDESLSEVEQEILVEGKVTTDIVIPTGEGLEEIVIAAKISTRERGVQAWVHARILEYYSDRNLLKKHRCILVAVSETQRLKRKVQDTCIPRQVALYQKYVSKMDGLYYLDPPPAYLKLNQMKIVAVRTISDLLSEDLASYLTPRGSRD